MGTPSNASHLNQASLIDGWETRAIYTGTGAAVPVKLRGKNQTLTRQGVGLYTLTLVDVGGQLADVEGITHTAATVGPQVWKMVAGSFNSSTKSVSLECWNVVAAALADPPVGAQVSLTPRFFTNITDT